MQRKSSWAHKGGTTPLVNPVIELHPITRDLTGLVHLPGGCLPGAEYERVRGENPQLLLPALNEIPYKTSLLTH